jgi:hypothetical protein
MEICNRFAGTTQLLIDEVLGGYKTQHERMTTCAQALKNWEAANNMPAEDADYIKLYCQIPPIIKMDSSLNSLRNCE